MFVADILRMKGSTVFSIVDTRSVRDAVQELATHRIGALLVRDGSDAVVGIFSERDVVRALSTGGAAVLDQPVGEYMTRRVVHCAPTDDVCDVLGTMTERRFRHVPVMDGESLAGMISIGDVVKARIDDAVAEADALRDYIAQ